MPGLIIDLSSNNAHPIDYAAAKAAGVVGVIVKATDGLTYVNPFYDPDVAGFEAVGVPVIAYHFAEFGDAAAEAAKFVSVAGARARVLDVETSTDGPWQNAFLAALHLPADEEMDYGSASSLPRSGIRSLLWPASYGKEPGFGDCWQSTDSQNVPGIGTCDASQWIGSQADFDALFSVGAPAPSPAPPTPTEDPMTGVSPAIFTPDGFEHRAQIVYPGVLMHIWIDGTGKPQHENVAAVADPTGGPISKLTFDGNQVPTCQLAGDEIILGAQTAVGSTSFEFVQKVGTAAWGAREDI